jgi:hypothetical protein
MYYDSILYKEILDLYIQNKENASIVYNFGLMAVLVPLFLKKYGF